MRTSVDVTDRSCAAERSGPSTADDTVDGPPSRALLPVNTLARQALRLRQQGRKRRPRVGLKPTSSPFPPFSHPRGVGPRVSRCLDFASRRRGCARCVSQRARSRRCRSSAAHTSSSRFAAGFVTDDMTVIQRMSPRVGSPPSTSQDRRTASALVVVDQRVDEGTRARRWNSFSSEPKTRPIRARSPSSTNHSGSP